MCFNARYWSYADNKRLWATVQKTQRPIVCYKYFSRTSHNAKTIISPVRDHRYIVGERYDEPRFGDSVAELKCKTYSYGDLYHGVHSFTSLSALLSDIGGMIHSPYSVFKCYIPKGVRYIHNPEDRQYLSESIIVSSWVGSSSSLAKKAA